MKNTLLLSMLLSAGCCAYAGPVLTLDPSTGSIQGAPGATVGWGFTLSSDPSNWISVVTSALLVESNPALGSYMDFAGLLGGPDNGVLAPGAPDWTVAFDLNNGLGLGAFSISPGAAAGELDAGTLDLNYETFSADPNVCGTCATGFADLQAPFQVEVVQATPEPAIALPAALALLLFGCRRRRRSLQP